MPKTFKRKDGGWLSAMPGRRWAKHGDAVISLLCGAMLVAIVVTA